MKEEHNIELSILEYLNSLPLCIAEKVESVAIYDPTRKAFRTNTNKFKPNGRSDIAGCYKGTSLRIEVKTPSEYKYIVKHYDVIGHGTYCTNVKKKNRLRSQIHYLEKYTKLGAICFFADSVEMVKYELTKRGLLCG